MIMHKGTITGFGGSWVSGMGCLIIDGIPVPCENAPTVRALDRCFGNVIGEGHTVNNEDGGHIGQEVYYTTDFMGILEGFTPVEDAPEEFEDYVVATIRGEEDD